MAFKGLRLVGGENLKEAKTKKVPRENYISSGAQPPIFSIAKPHEARTLNKYTPKNKQKISYTPSTPPTLNPKLKNKTHFHCIISSCNKIVLINEGAVKVHFMLNHKANIKKSGAQVILRFANYGKESLASFNKSGPYKKFKTKCGGHIKIPIVVPPQKIRPKKKGSQDALDRAVSAGAWGMGRKGGGGMKRRTRR